VSSFSSLHRRRVAIVTIVLAFAMLASGCAEAVRIARSASSSGLVGNTKEEQLALDILTRVNAERAARGLNALALDPGLSTGAFAWSQTMAAQNSMHHSNLNTWITPFIADAENIAWETSPGMTSGDMHVMWMRSDGHRHNVLAPNLTHVGIGVVCSNGRMWGTERFGSTGSPAFGGLPPVEPIARADRGTLSC
jgi:uncharacterized protein YkwD